MRFSTKVLGIGALCSVAVAVAAAQTQPPAGQSRTGAGQGQSTTGQGQGSAGLGQNQAGHVGGAGVQNAPRFDAARFLKDHDTNHDGKLSKDELPPSARDEFNQIDANHDGAISQQELQQYAAKMAQQRPQLVEVIWYAIDVPEEPLTTQELQTAYDQLRQLDKNHDGKIDEGELRSYREQRRKERVDNIFEAMDKNKDGKISKDEARGLWADDFNQLDKNHDGVIDRQEAEQALAMPAGHGGHATAHDGGSADHPNKK